MADSREPPPLFNDDDDSHKDDDNDDLFTSAVQSPVSELTTPEEPRRQEGLGDPLTSPSPAASPTPDPPGDSPAGNPTDLFESGGEPPVGGLSSVSLESPTGGEGTQQVSSEAQDPALLHLASSAPINAQDHDPSLSLSSSSVEPALPSPTNIEGIPALVSPFTSLLNTFPQDSVSPSIVEDASIDFAFGQSLVSGQDPLDALTSPLKESQTEAPGAIEDPLSLDTDMQDITSTLKESQTEAPGAIEDPLSLDTDMQDITSPLKESQTESPGAIEDPLSLHTDTQDITSPLKESQTESPSAIEDPLSLHTDTQDIFSSPPPAPVVTTQVPDPVVNSSVLIDEPLPSSSPDTIVPDASVSPPVPTCNDILLDLGMNLPQELPSDPDTTLEVSLEDEIDDSALFNATSAPKLQLSQDTTEPPVPASSILPPMGAPLTPPVAPITPTVTPTITPSVTPAAPAPETPIAAIRQSPDELEAESGDDFIEIQISDPQKIGDGMSSYMAYKVTTKTNITYFRKKNWSVTRRFSDFLGLHGKLVEKHLHSGRIIPPAPEKSAIGTTKIKLGSDKTAESGSQDFIEKRRASLERYMHRTSAHPTLRADPDFREFVELDAELPKATQTSALSSAGVLRLFNRVGETVNKMTFKMDESDQWFEEKTQQIESLDAQLRKLQLAMDGLVAYRRELAISTAAFAKSSAILSSVEEHSALSRALHQLAESTERTHTIHHAQADADFYYLSEITRDYIQLIGAVKDVFHERVKTFQTWQHAQAMLAKKREAKAKAELAGRMDKVQQAQEEVAEWESKVERSQEEFDRISRAIKKEVDRFDIVRVKDFKDMLVKYLEALMTSQQQIIKVWETFMPEAKAIA